MISAFPLRLGSPFRLPPGRERQTAPARGDAAQPLTQPSLRVSRIAPIRTDAVLPPPLKPRYAPEPFTIDHVPTSFARPVPNCTSTCATDPAIWNVPSLPVQLSAPASSSTFIPFWSTVPFGAP